MTTAGRFRGKAGAPDAPARCPSCARPGPAVAWKTVKALIRTPPPPQQRHWLCREPACPVVYFGDGGRTIEAHELSVTPGFKGDGRGLVCYCFAHRRDEIEDEVSALGRSEILESIRREVRNGHCACALRNPSGKCCLAEVRTIAAATASQGVAP